MATMGKNIWDNLTTGMYADSRIIFREYIQNSCDAIDSAIKKGILLKENAKIDIVIDADKRYISVEDNGVGIPSEEFQRKVGNVADSDKELGVDKGFRGIGRLCGLAYCEKIEFSSKAKGENTISIMTMDAAKLRELLYNDKTKYTFDDVYEKIVTFTTKESAESNKHFFKVELFNINNSNSDLLDKQGIMDYLSFVAPVPYVNNFHYSKKIYEHVKEIDVKLDEYRILVNSETVLKHYKTYLYDDGKKSDEVYDIVFKDFFDKNGNLIAWMWYGISMFNGALDKSNAARALRLRKENIQIGDEDTLDSIGKFAKPNKKAGKKLANM